MHIRNTIGVRLKMKILFLNNKKHHDINGVRYDFGAVIGTNKYIGEHCNHYGKRYFILYILLHWGSLGSLRGRMFGGH
jgi:hypothetical protein